MQKTEKGITLIALVITIIILLILAGIAISQLTGENGLFNYAKRAKNNTLEAQELENTILGDYENKINEITGNEEPKGVTLASKVQVGDYVKYEIDPASTATINSLLTELGTYSGSTANNSSTLVQETNLNWRVLDKVKDENGNDCVRLISATPTNTSTVALNGYNGYNNAVYLIDKVCSTLYNKTGYTEKVQNLKIEDIEEYMKTKPTYDTTTKYSPTDKFYPSILAQEKGQTVNGTTGTLDKSKQNAPITQAASQQVSSWRLIKTYWAQTMTSESLEEGYYNLFINDGKANYKTYWMSSRCVEASSSDASFVVRYVYSGNVNAYYLYYSDDNPDENAYAVRPVITLKSNVEIDTEKSGDGTEVGKEYILK